MLTIRTKGAGPSAPRWVRLNETEVGRPHFRLKKNPVAASSSQSSTVFPYAPELQTLELVRWALFDVAETLNVLRNLKLKGIDVAAGVIAAGVGLGRRVAGVE